MQPPLNLAYTDCFEHNFDEKGRITVPKEWRGEGFEQRLLVIPAESHLRVYPASFLARKMELLKDAPWNDPRLQSLQKLAQIVQTVDLDPQNRMVVKEKFRVKAGLKKSAVLAGKLNHFEIWDRAVWNKQTPVEPTFEQIAMEAGL